MTPSRTIETRAASLLSRAGITKPPVAVERIAIRLGLQVEPVALGDDVSGVLVITDGKGMIGYNKDHSVERQRFTIAHEVGHFVLHSASAQLFIDKQYFAAFRDARSSKGVDVRERQANAFAAALLMPTALVRREIATRHFDLGDEGALTELAELFRVSTQAMAYRLANLGLFSALAT